MAHLFTLIRHQDSREVMEEGKIKAVEVETYQSDGQRIKCKGLTEESLQEFLDNVPVEEGVVDENGQSWEAEGLFVCDASVLPTAIGVNPMITIQSTSYYISNKIAQLLKKE
ncbi:hypothetical protein GOBAR_DD18029 [Gossypium barbadense]|nr:hypothetical protein GOBAR_DD18029 [Gossypium barbadense]